MPLVLIVDDNPEFRGAVSRTILAAGYNVEQAAQGIEALRLIEQRRPDIVVTDILMPDCDGVELISALRRDYPSVRILAISGRAVFGALNLLDLATVIGADATLAKPFDPRDLTGKLAELSSAVR